MARRKVAQLNALVAVDKPLGITSHDVVARVRRAVGERPVGHAGTLDPLASGVMVVGIGQATRLLGMLALDEKSYLAQIRFGAETATDDAEGEVTRRAPVRPELFDTAFAARAVAGLVGAHLQVPPAYSAISVDGVRSYARARAGEELELEARPIEVREATLFGIADDAGAPVWTVGFTVSKGTYIRALARDLGRALDSAAHLAGLRRTASGSVDAARCVALDDVTVEAVREAALDPVAALGLPALPVDEALMGDILCGKAVPVRGAEALEGGRAALTCAQRLVALADIEFGRARPRDVFPQPIEGVRP